MGLQNRCHPEMQALRQIVAEGRLKLLAVNMTNNTAAAGANVFLGRPLASVPEVDLLGVCTDFEYCPSFQGDTLWHQGAHITSSCLSACELNPIAPYQPVPHASCDPLTANGPLGVHCSCRMTVLGAETDEQRELGPYGQSPVDALLGLPMPSCALL